jgi:hypothetical protein
MNQVFLSALTEKGWTEFSYDSEYRKGSWVIVRDTGSWWMIFIMTNQRVFDFPEPSDITAGWTVNLIEHLCMLTEKNG